LYVGASKEDAVADELVDEHVDEDWTLIRSIERLLDDLDDTDIKQTETSETLSVEASPIFEAASPLNGKVEENSACTGTTTAPSPVLGASGYTCAVAASEPAEVPKPHAEYQLQPGQASQRTKQESDAATKQWPITKTTTSTGPVGATPTVLTRAIHETVALHQRSSTANTSSVEWPSLQDAVKIKHKKRGRRSVSGNGPPAGFATDVQGGGAWLAKGTVRDAGGMV
jgi:hypothetical protein